MILQVYFGQDLKVLVEVLLIVSIQGFLNLNLGLDLVIVERVCSCYLCIKGAKNEALRNNSKQIFGELGNL